MNTTTEADALLALVERLGGPDWRASGEAYGALVAAGEAGREAVRHGLTHPRPRVQAACADFYDHLGRDEDVPVLCEVLDDPVPSVRRQVVHSLACQRCKPAPLQADLTETLIGLALDDPTPRVRREAVYGLGNRAPNARIVAALEQIMATDTNAKVVREARGALRRQSLPHRQAAVEAAKARQKMLETTMIPIETTPKTILVVDVEATCWEGSPPPGQQAEIIEIGYALLDVPAREVREGGSLLVRPQRSRVSAFCTSLTTLTPEMVGGGVTFEAACRFLTETLDSRSLTWASYGDYDRKQFARQCESFGVPYPFGEAHLNVKSLFARAHDLPREVGMAAALKLLERPLTGTHHRGGDDARNIAGILADLLRPAPENGRGGADRRRPVGATPWR